MTNKEILDVFTERYPNVSVNDYRPIADMYMPKGRQGITIWTDTNDVILFFPCTGGADNCPLHEVTADHDTISRKQAIDALEKSRFPGAPYIDRGILIALREIKKLPPSPTPSRPQGHWVRVPVANGLDRYRCDKCGHYVTSGDDKNFCPNCGADM